jgi:hypothetical protein
MFFPPFLFMFISRRRDCGNVRNSIGVMKGLCVNSKSFPQAVISTVLSKADHHSVYRFLSCHLAPNRPGRIFSPVRIDSWAHLVQG